MPLEIEAKFTHIDNDVCRVKLAAAGFTCVRPWSRMRRYTFVLSEMPGNSDSSKWARIRDEGDKITMTYKHAFDSSRVDGTEEVEIVVSDFDTAALMLEKLGYTDKLYQENHRETWVRDGVEVTLNEWPALVSFAEIEAADESTVRNVSNELGFDFATAMFGGVGRVYKEINGWDMDKVRNLTFANSDAIINQFQTNN
ncbi:MAG: hypothetical protein DI585_06465 [Pseudomonas fluorescens]|nr:MAG: hypothetical protein DI585_06465 [Pseudomonas fluorescens]